MSIKNEYGELKLYQVWFNNGYEYDLIVAPSEERAKELFKMDGTGSTFGEALDEYRKKETRANIVHPEEVLEIVDEETGKKKKQSALNWAMDAGAENVLGSTMY